MAQSHKTSKLDRKFEFHLYACLGFGTQPRYEATCDFRVK